MLKFFRHKNITRFVLWALLILILPAFVLWGTGNLGRSGQKGPTFAGTIDGRKVSFEDFYKSIMHIRSQVILNYFDRPRTLDAFINNRELMGKLAWDRLLMENEALKNGIKVKDTEVIEYIKSHPIFLRNGVFDDKVYNYILKQSMGLDPRSFEEIVRQNLAIQKLNDMMTKGISVSDEEVVEAYRKDNEKFAIACIVFSSDNRIKDVKIDEDKIKDYYEAHKNKFIEPAPGKDEAGKARFEEVKKSIREHLATEEAKRLAVEEAKKEYGRVNALILKDKISLEDAAARLGLKIKRLQPFARTDYLDGIGEAAAITDTAVKLKSGEISSPVEIRKGAVIFRVTEVKKYDAKKFEEEKADFQKKALADKKMRALEDWLRNLELQNKPNIDFADYEKHFR